jgi:hypothetical protein
LSSDPIQAAEKLALSVWDFLSGTGSPDRLPTRRGTQSEPPRSDFPERSSQVISGRSPMPAVLLLLSLYGLMRARRKASRRLSVLAVDMRNSG